jgi:hypothetical protein
MANEFETILLEGEKIVEVGVADALKIFGAVTSKSPAAIAGLTALAGAVEKVFADGATDAANPAQLILTLPSQVSDLKAVWPDVKTFLASIGVK